MKMKLAILCTGLALSPHLLLASANDVDFTVDLGQVTSEFEYQNGATPFDIELNSVAFYYGETMANRMRGALHVAYADSKLKQNNTSESMEGYFGGIEFNFFLIHNDRQHLALNVGYAYHRLEEDNKAYRLRWQEYRGGVSYHLNLTNRIALTAGADYIDTDGEQIFAAPGAAQDFSGTENSQFTLSISYKLDETGSIGLRGYTGHREGGILFLRREYK